MVGTAARPRLRLRIEADTFVIEVDAAGVNRGLPRLARIPAQTECEPLQTTSVSFGMAEVVAQLRGG
jgi:hypothetical protein